MRTSKMKSFNVKMYNEKMAELDNAIKIVNEYIRECRVWYPEKRITPQFIQQLFTSPTDLFQKLLRLTMTSTRITSEPCSRDLNVYQIRVIHTMADAVIKEFALAEILPYVKESYGKLFEFREKEDYDFGDAVFKTKKAKRLIMKQCIEWE